MIDVYELYFGVHVERAVPNQRDAFVHWQSREVIFSN